MSVFAHVWVVLLVICVVRADHMLGTVGGLSVLGFLKNIFFITMKGNPGSGGARLSSHHSGGRSR